MSTLLEASTAARSPVSEFFCTVTHKLYYYDATAKHSAWEPPPAIILREVLTDMASYGLPAMDALLCFQVRSFHRSCAPASAREAVDCGAQMPMLRDCSLPA